MVMTTIIQPDIRSALQMASTFRYLNLTPIHRLSFSRATVFHRPPSSLRLTSAAAISVRAFSTDETEIVSSGEKVTNKPSICTADELHYVTVKNSDWRLALWRYYPSPQAQARNHPLLLLSGVGTNAIGYDLSAGSSFARYMSEQGFDTWILELRGAGLSMHGSNPNEIEQSAHAISDRMEAAVESGTDGVLSAAQESTNGHCAPTESEIAATSKDPLGLAAADSGTNDVLSTSEESTTSHSAPTETKVAVTNEDPTGLATVWDESRLVTKLTETFMLLSERLSGFLSEGQSRIISVKLFDQISKLLEDSFLAERFEEIRKKLLSLLEARENSAVASQIRDLSQKLVNVFEEGQRSVSPQLFDLQERLTTTIEDFQKQLDLIIKYDWDFDHYLEEDVPAAMEYIKAQTQPKDGKLLAIGHSMGGILLYSMLSRFGAGGRESGLAAVVTLASSLDYTSSKSSLKLLLPLADPAQALNVPVVPLGALLTAAYPLASGPPYVLSWLNHMISAEDMMHPELLKKLILNNFCTIPAKLLLQLTTAFRERGLCDRSGTFFYKDHIHKTDVPVLAVAGDRDLICPPEAVLETVKLIPENLVTYKLFGEPKGPHYAHYDLVGGRMAVDELYPCIVQFLSHHDST